MRQWNDAELLSAYANRQSEQAFEVLVERHIALVYSAAMRQVQNPQLAEDVTQATFTILAQKARSLASRTTISGWLCRTAHLLARNALKTEVRRYYREQEAHMQSLANEPSPEIWPQFAPLLDEAVAQLKETDRSAVVLRYFEQKSLDEVGNVLGVAPDAAQKRVARALETLRKFFARHGVNSTTAAIAENISAHSIQAVPAALAKSVTAAALAKGATASISTTTLVKGAMKVMAWSKAQTAIVVGAGVLLIVGTTAVTVKKVEAYKTSRESWRTLNLDSAIVDQSLPQVRILPTKFPGQRSKLSENNAATKWAGLNIPASVMMWVAYEWSPARVVFAGPAPSGRYDFITSLPQGSYGALQRELKDRLGVVGRLETRDVNALALKVKTPDASGLKPPIVGSQNDWSKIGEYMCDDRALSNDNPPPYPPLRGLQGFLEGYFDMPVLDETGLTNHYRIDLKWKELGGRDQGHQSLKQALLDQLGLELVPSQESVEMLVVEKAK